MDVRDFNKHLMAVREPLLLARAILKQGEISLPEYVASHMHESFDVGNTGRLPDRDQIGQRHTEAIDGRSTEGERLNVGLRRGRCTIYSKGVKRKAGTILRAPLSRLLTEERLGSTCAVTIRTEAVYSSDEQSKTGAITLTIARRYRTGLALKGFSTASLN